MRQDERVLALWRAGVSLRKIVEDTRLSNEQVREILRTHGAKPLRKGGRPKRV